MKYYKRKSFWVSLVSASIMMVAFQNCGPAQLTGTAKTPAIPEDPRESGEADSEQPAPTPAPTAFVRIQSRLNLTAYFSVSSATNGTALTLWNRVDSAGQNFQFTSAGEVRVAGKCLNAPGNLGQYIVLGDCLGTAHQKWTYVSARAVIQSGNDHCIEILNGNTAPGSPLVLNTCTNSVNQQWNLQP